MTAQTRKQARLALTAYALLTAGTLLTVVGVAGLAKIAAQKGHAEPTVTISQVQYMNNHWQDRVNDLSEACGNALDQVAAAMSEEEFDSVPLEVWRSAYQQCLFDAKVTI